MLRTSSLAEGIPTSGTNLYRRESSLRSENLVLAKVRRHYETDADINDAARSAQIHGFIAALLAQYDTPIIITHRLVGLDNIDQIIVLRAGRIVERGTHQELSAAGEVYRRMFDLQNQILY